MTFDTKGYVPIKSQMGEFFFFLKENHYIKWVEWLSGETFELLRINGSSIFA